jgi:hypothetical protein
VKASVGVNFSVALLDECAGQTVHHTVISFTLLSVAEEVFTQHGCPVFLKTISPCLEEASTLELKFGVGSSGIATEIVKDHFLAHFIVAAIHIDHRRIRFN